MTVQLNHTIVPARDPQASAQFLAGILGLSVDPPLAHFTPVTLANEVSLDYDQSDAFEPHHCAFMVSDQEFEAAPDPARWNHPLRRSRMPGNRAARRRC